MTPPQNQKRSAQFPRLVYRKHIIIPTEHGSWPWLLVPYFVGVGVVQQFNLPMLFTLIGGLAVFLIRQPATVWMRARRGKARAADGPIAATWICIWLIIGLVCFSGLLVAGRSAILWLILPFIFVLSLYLFAARYGRSGIRSLWMELAGAAALSLMAPAATIAADGQFEPWEWALWGLLAIQNVLGALYVRLRIADTHKRSMKRWPVFAAHLAGFIFVLGLGVAGKVPLLTAVPYSGFLFRAGWAAATPRAVANIKRFGFLELGIEILSGLWLVGSYWL